MEPNLSGARLINDFLKNPFGSVATIGQQDGLRDGLRNRPRRILESFVGIDIESDMLEFLH